MRPLPDPPAGPPATAIATLGDLRQLQSRLAALATAIAARVDVPLPRLGGRVLAEDVPGAPGEPAPRLARGTRLEARHLPLLAGGPATQPALARARIGVLAMAGADAAARRPHTGAGASAAWVAATLERLGAQAFAVACRDPEPRRFMERLEMLVGECELVVVVGFLDPAQCEAVRDAQRRRGQPATVECLQPRPFGALQVMPLGATLVVAVAAELDAAVGAVTTLLTPLVRRLQGRTDWLPPVRAAALDDPANLEAARWRLLPVRVDPGALATSVRVAACSGADAAAVLAAADGLAWRAADFAGFERPTVAYFSFDAWGG